MLPEYIEYWNQHKASCVGLSRIGKKWSAVYADGKTIPCSFIWSYIPSMFIGYNKKGICLKWRK